MRLSVYVRIYFAYLSDVENISVHARRALAVRTSSNAYTQFCTVAQRWREFAISNKLSGDNWLLRREIERAATTDDDDDTAGDGVPSKPLSHVFYRFGTHRKTARARSHIIKRRVAVVVIVAASQRPTARRHHLRTHEHQSLSAVYEGNFPTTAASRNRCVCDDVDTHTAMIS